ncbi:ATP-binding protein [Candidatus Neomarinimicrobiota bacterium]
MMKIEITEKLSLTDEQDSLLSMHSILNTMNVLISQIYQLADFLDDKSLVQNCMPPCKEIVAALSDHDDAIESIRNIGRSVQEIQSSIADVIARHPDLRTTEQLQAHTDNIESIFTILEVRGREILARANQPDMWINYSIDDLINNFHDIFTAIEQNAHGKYKIVYNIASKNTLDYFINCGISSPDQVNILMPAVLQDVMRDLILNARKYTDLGGTIIAGLVDDGANLFFVVEDNGRGIPADQIEQVVQYGERARNVQDKETKGGGFGLTKAYYVTKQFGGRMWIESEENRGSTITISIPSQLEA